MNTKDTTPTSEPSTFDPSGIAIPNGNYFCFETTVDEAEIVFQSIPWDVTTSYKAGTSLGPKHILGATEQVDLYSPSRKKVWEIKLGTVSYPEEIETLNHSLRKKTESYIEFLGTGKKAQDSKVMEDILEEANHESEKLHHHFHQKTLELILRGKKVLTIGGDHSVSFGPILAHSEKYKNLSILHFDAHADLREAYEGFPHSHASIMNLAAGFPGVKKLVQVGIRDVSEQEINRIERDPKITTYFDWDMKTRLYNGESFGRIADEIVSHLSDEVYISFDIDALDPKLCPDTGTPVPGGLEFEQALDLIWRVKKSGRKIVGADLVEVAPSSDPDNEWNGNVGARLLFQLMLTL